MPKPMNIQQFFQMFPDDDSCLEHLFHTRCGDAPKCERCGDVGKFRKLSKSPAWTCNCGHHIHPMVGTPFARTRTPLQKWYYAMFLFTATRNGVSAKEIQRQLGVTYKTAWRIAHEIRKYMNWVDGDGPLGPHGIVEADKAFIGGKDKMGHDDKSIVLGVVERDGEVVTRVIPNRRENTVVMAMEKLVARGTRIATDEARAFSNLREYGYHHASVNHAKKEYVRGPVHTNTIEGFWSWVKRGINGTHVWVSEKHLPKYLGEFEFRFNLRTSPHLMFPLLVSSFQRP
jgi:hypothetical protein